jgi:hypothetical protein
MAENPKHLEYKNTPEGDRRGAVETVSSDYEVARAMIAEVADAKDRAAALEEWKVLLDESDFSILKREFGTGEPQGSFEERTNGEAREEGKPLSGEQKIEEKEPLLLPHYPKSYDPKKYERLESLILSAGSIETADLLIRHFMEKGIIDPARQEELNNLAHALFSPDPAGTGVPIRLDSKIERKTPSLPESLDPRYIDYRKAKAHYDFFSDLLGEIYEGEAAFAEEEKEYGPSAAVARALVRERYVRFSGDKENPETEFAEEFPPVKDIFGRAVADQTTEEDAQYVSGLYRNQRLIVWDALQSVNCGDAFSRLLMEREKRGLPYLFTVEQFREIYTKLQGHEAVNVADAKKTMAQTIEHEFREAQEGLKNLRRGFYRKRISFEEPLLKGTASQRVLETYEEFNKRLKYLFKRSGDLNLNPALCDEIYEEWHQLIRREQMKARRERVFSLQREVTAAITQNLDETLKNLLAGVRRDMPHLSQDAQRTYAKNLLLETFVIPNEVEELMEDYIDFERRFESGFGYFERSERRRAPKPEKTQAEEEEKKQEEAEQESPGKPLSATLRELLRIKDQLPLLEKARRRARVEGDPSRTIPQDIIDTLLKAVGDEKGKLKKREHEEMRKLDKIRRGLEILSGMFLRRESWQDALRAAGARKTLPRDYLEAIKTGIQKRTAFHKN